MKQTHLLVSHISLLLIKYLHLFVKGGDTHSRCVLELPLTVPVFDGADGWPSRPDLCTTRSPFLYGLVTRPSAHWVALTTSFSHAFRLMCRLWGGVLVAHVMIGRVGASAADEDSDEDKAPKKKPAAPAAAAAKKAAPAKKAAASDDDSDGKEKNFPKG